MLTKNKLFIIFSICIFLGVVQFNLSSNFNDSLIATTINQEVNNTLIGPDQNSVDTEFKVIQAIPYNEKSMNCKNKSELFAAYLKENGAQDVGIVTIMYSSDQYSHEFVDWNGHFYDTCNSAVVSYKLSKDEYLTKLEKIGFTGVTFESPYPNN
jgi:hypothetical protein